MKTINVNIWDDFYEDGYVPEGEIQETYLYIEDSSISLDEEKSILTEILPLTKNWFGSEVEIGLKLYNTEELYPHMKNGNGFRHFKRWEIRLKNLSHKKLQKVMMKIEKKPQTIKQYKLNIYSES